MKTKSNTKTVKLPDGFNGIVKLVLHDATINVTINKKEANKARDFGSSGDDTVCKEVLINGIPTVVCVEN